MAENQIQIPETLCIRCQTRYQENDLFVGKKVSCKKCGNSFDAYRIDITEDDLSVGKIAMAYKFITEKQLQEALIIYRFADESGRNETLSEILAKKNFVTQAQMKILHYVVDFFRLRKLDQKFGEIAVSKVYLTKENISKAAEIQSKEFKENKSVRKIGDILIELGYLTKEQCDSILIEQKRIDPLPPVIETSKDSFPGILKEVKDDEVMLITSEDKLTTHIKKLKEFSDKLSPESIKIFLKKKGIIYGIINDLEIQNFINQPFSIDNPDNNFIIAIGKPSKHGKSAYIKYYFEIDHLKAGSVANEGKIDFKDRGKIPHVKNGALLAEKIPMVKGETGIDVYGRPINIPDVRDISLKSGKNTQLSNDELQIFATADGQPKALPGARFEVISEIHIMGDVGYETGHVIFEGCIDVKGSIQNGFQVKCASLKVQEILAADIDVSGDINVDGGILGTKIRCGGNINAKFINNAKILAYGNINVKKEIFECDIKISGLCSSPQGKIISSNVSAKKGIVSEDIGTEMSKPCKLRVGVEDHVEAEIEEINQVLAIKYEKLEELKVKESSLEQAQAAAYNDTGELASAQDKEMMKKDLVNKKIVELRENKETEALARAELLIKEIVRKISEIDESMDKLFDKQEVIQKTLAEIKENKNIIETEIKDLAGKKEKIIEWAKQDKPNPTIKVASTIYEKTTIFGTRASVVLDNNYKKVNIREVMISDPDSDPIWEIRIS
ncbi:MAG: DUF342 domain-containing protein [Desulfobacterales bacterium]|nr:DUF342 domain-containing protein [Desulfobacterales bacterium]